MITLTGRNKNADQRQRKCRSGASDAEERYERHRHYAATFLLENQAALASRLERVLFEQGFWCYISAPTKHRRMISTRSARRKAQRSRLSGDVLGAEQRKNASPMKRTQGCSTCHRRRKMPPRGKSFNVLSNLAGFHKFAKLEDKKTGQLNADASGVPSGK